MNTYAQVGKALASVILILLHSCYVQKLPNKRLDAKLGATFLDIKDFCLYED